MRSRRRKGAAAIWFALLLVIASALGPIALGFDLPPSQPGQSVYDFASIWSASTVASAEHTAEDLRARTGVEMAIVSIPTGYDSVDTSTAEDDAKQIMDTWGVGKAGVNNGIVVLFDLDTTLRHGQIYVYGGSGIISTYMSPTAAQNIANDMIARAKAGDLDGALSVGMTQIADAVDHPGTRLETTPLVDLPTVGLLLVDVAILVVMFGLWWRDGRDPPIPLIDDSVLLPAPPQGLTPSMAALLHDAGPSKSAPAAALVDLASRNLIAMREGSTFLGLGRKPIDFVVSDRSDPRVVHAESLVGEPERVILRELRGIAEGGVVEHTHLTRAPQMLTNFAAALGRAAAATPWFRADPNRSVNRMTGVPFIAILPMMGVLWLGNGKTGVESSILIGFAATVVTVAIGVAIAKSMAARTKEGSWVLGMALAYRNTLRHEMGQAPGVVSAQQHAKLKLPWLETPDALIVWAIALGLANEVGDLLSRSMSDPASAQWHPAWYSGSAVSFASFGSSISSITTTVASSSGGGYGGGGSGGGGGGGGGF